jgi:polysaccharide deacetylase 2 family uncharacterized protein YibQ
MRGRRTLTRFARIMALLAAVGHAAVADADEPLPAIGIIIDDLGYSLADGERALALPGAVTYSILPRTPLASTLSQRAAVLGKDVLMHLPMEAEHGNQQLGPGAIILGMSREEVVQTMIDNLATVPDAIGVNNHMGSVLTAELEPMTWVMQALREHGNLMYVDSRTTPRTVAARAASAQQLPFLDRDVFLDNESGYDYARQQFLALISHARRHGHALAIGHPRPGTLRVLEEFLPDIERQGVRLIGLQELLGVQSRNEQQRSTGTWQLSSSHSQTAVKNWKPSPSSICCVEPSSPSSRLH